MHTNKSLHLAEHPLSCGRFMVLVVGVGVAIQLARLSGAATGKIRSSIYGALQPAPICVADLSNWKPRLEPDIGSLT